MFKTSENCFGKTQVHFWSGRKFFFGRLFSRPKVQALVKKRIKKWVLCYPFCFFLIGRNKKKMFFSNLFDPLKLINPCFKKKNKMKLKTIFLCKISVILPLFWLIVCYPSCFFFYSAEIKKTNFLFKSFCSTLKELTLV